MMSSRGSLCSTDSFLYSEGEAGDEDLDVFLSDSEGDARGGGRPPMPPSPRGESVAARPRPQSPNSLRLSEAAWRRNRGYSPLKPAARTGQGSSGRVTAGSRLSSSPPLSTTGPGLKRTRSSEEGRRAGPGRHDDSGRPARAEGDLVFTEKCRELQGFLKPLLELLNGLKRGRYHRGLSSFQQSVAMDRIQRIVGVIQKPAVGGRYLSTLLQVEMMLKLWFPHITPTSTPDIPKPGRTPERQGAPHTPAKQSCSPDRVSEETLSASAPLHTSSSQQHPGNSVLTAQEESSRPGRGYPERPPCRWSEPSLTWIHASPICAPLHPNNGPGALRAPHSPSFSPATQDSSISSTTPSPRLLQGCGPIRCRSVPVTGAGGSRTLAECQGGSVSLPALLAPPPPGTPLLRGRQGWRGRCCQSQMTS
ncbi:circadian-associated transcriptional repressor isoform X1 [Acipenser oxyrinchus oxyrinchus]|uniref:Circadian-associated transcriptional repressor isoform X1 n=1 Tax=Acipenser oxyrinchus oxyrinchus TaxID=40147 RepID=A0AAD8FRS0_ACIOX|nr:circadian-associated transcriptional repressor isoform X1 [Acipenser oxyrinchus oxyrinchus]